MVRIMGVERLRIKALSRFLTNHDLITRFLYTQIPFVSDLLKKTMAKKLYIHQQNFEDINIDARMSEKLLDSLSIDCARKTIMVVGPGTSLSLPLSCLLRGATKVYLIDPFPRLYPEIIRKYLIYYEEKTGKDLEEYLESKTLRFNEERLCFIKTYLEHIERIPSNSIDLVISRHVLEHIHNIEDSVRELSRVMRIEAVMCHKIDLRDHFNFKKPLKFLKYSDFVWKNFSTKVGYSYTNRLRIDDYFSLFRRCHFTVIGVKRKMLRGKINVDGFNKKFRTKDIVDLRTTACTIIAKREK